jgi:hypothetical protein
VQIRSSIEESVTGHVAAWQDHGLPGHPNAVVEIGTEGANFITVLVTDETGGTHEFEVRITKRRAMKRRQ